MRTILIGFLLLVSCATAVPQKPLPDPLGHGAARDQWLFDQRAYPFGEIPADARRKALDEVRERERFRAAAQTDPAFTPFWRPIGPLPLNTAWPWKTATGRVKALAISPQDPNVVLAGSSSGGIWRSIDAGATFTPVSDHHADLSIGAIAFAPSDPSIAYAVSGSDFLGTGVLKSTDSGATWQVVDGPTFAPRGTANRIVIDPQNANRLWVAQTSRQDASSGNIFSSGLLRSEDGGFSWTTDARGLVSDFAAAPGSATSFLLGVPRHDGGGTAGVQRSTDGGRTWTLVFPGKGTLPRFVFAHSRTTPGRVYLHSLMENTPRFHVSSDGGATWSDVAATLPPSRPIFLAAHPSKEQIYLGYPGGDLHVSTDGGATWRNITKGRNEAGNFDPQFSLTHIDQHALVFSPADDRVMYLGNDGGIYKSTDGGATFTSLAGALSLIQAYGIAAHPLDPAMIYLGTQDNGLARLRNGSWREMITGDYGSILFDHNDPSYIVTNYVYGTILSFSANGELYFGERADNSTFGEIVEPYRIQFIAPFEQQASTGTLYFGTWKLFASYDFGRSWNTPAGSLDFTRGGTDTLSAIGLSPDDPYTIYTGSATGKLMRSRDGGETWTDVTGTQPQRYVKAITVDPEDPGVAWLAYSGYRTAHVYRTSDYGATWTAVSAGLPDVPVNALFLHPADRNVVYAGTDIGVFGLDGTQWRFLGNGMPPVVVTGFDMTANGRLVAATYGRGAYELVTEMSPRRRSVRH
jgi:photosystem II stability/assembly factor-like uncharacterized protein